MVEIALHQKKVQANILAAQHRRRRGETRFLRRNLNHILDSHEQVHRCIINDTPSEDITATEIRMTSWQFPSQDMLRDLRRAEKPALQLDALQIRHPRSKSTIKKQSQGRLEESEGTDWLPDPDVDRTWRCHVGVNIYDTRTSATGKSRVYVESQPATISETRSNGYCQFDIALDRPFLIPVDSLHAASEAGSNESRNWKWTVTGQYALDITIQCNSSFDSANLLSRIEDRSAVQFQGSPPNEGVLKATWSNLPSCPAEGQLLAIKRPQGHKSLELPLKVEISMGWLRKGGSSIARQGKLVTQEQECDTQLPTPSTSNDLEKASKRCDIIWVFQQDGMNIRSATAHTLSCPICDDRLEHPSFDRLQLHCLTHHDHLTFESEDHNRSSNADSMQKMITVTLGKEPSDKLVKDSGDEIHMNWQAPMRPLDLAGYMHGTDDWPGYRAQRTKTAKPRGRAAQKEKESMSQATPVAARKRPALDEVEDLPKRGPKRHCVPNAPGVSFYRTTSKQLVNAGDRVSESDEDVDESWLAQKQGCALDELGISGQAKAFTRVFNQHLVREQSDSSTLARDCLVRFARAHRDELKRLEWQRLFIAKLKQFRNAKVIDDETATYLISYMQKASVLQNGHVEAGVATGAELIGGYSTSMSMHATEPRPRPSPLEHFRSGRREKKDDVEDDVASRRVRKRWNGGKFEQRDQPNGIHELTNGTASPSEVTSNDHTRGHADQLCSCGESAKSVRGSIACADPRCARKDFHLTCVNLERRVHGWRCSDCGV